MPRQKQSKPKALKQQREEVEQLIRDGGTSDTKKQDGTQSAKSTKHPDVSSAVEKAKRAKGKKRHRIKNATKVKIAKKVRAKRLTKALPGTEFPVSQSSTVKARNLSPNSNNNETPLTEIKELSSPNWVAEVGSEPAPDISDTDIFKNKYDMIKERSLLRATKVKKTNQDKDKAKDTESCSPKKGAESPKKIPVSPVKEPESLLPKSPPQVEQAPATLSPKPKLPFAQRKLSERDVRKSNSQDLISRTANTVKGRQRSVSEGIPTSLESKQQALEALLEITGVELHTMSKVPPIDQTPSTTARATTVTTLSTTHIAPQTSLSGVHKGGMVKISETDKGVVKYHLQSDSLEEQGLKLVYTAQSVGHANQEQLKYNAYNRSRKNSTKSNASDSAEDLATAKDSQKCCKKPGRHVCQFCGRRCTKPSVLKKHIRSHTGERPYPCLPCGFSFKTKSNLYKHCKTHAHAIKAGLTPNTEDLSKLALAELDEDDSEETESEDEITTCDATTCQTELTEKCLHTDTHIHVGTTPHSEIDSVTRISPESKTAKSSNIPTMQVTSSLAAVPNIPRQQADSQSNQKAISRHSSSWVPTLNSVLPTANIQMDMPLLSTLLPNQSSRSSDVSSVGRPSSAPSASSVEFPKTNVSHQDRHQAAETRNDEEVVMSASGASSSQLLKSILPGELAGFRIDMETRRAIPVLNPQLGTPGSPSSNPSAEESSSSPGQLLIPLTGFNIVKSGGQYHVQIPVQGIPEDSLTMSLEGETCPAVEESGSIPNQTKGVSKESLQERIQLLISQNRAIVDDTVLESVKPRRTSASRRDSENNSPKIESSLDPAIDVKSSDGRGIHSSTYPEFVNPSLRYRRGSLSEAHPSSTVSHSPKGYVLPGESNLLERVLKSQQQSSLVGPPGADKHILVPMSDHQAVKIEGSKQVAGNPSDNSNSIKDLLMQDRPHRLAQIAQQTPALISGESLAGQGSPRMNIIPGTSWPIPHGTDSAMSQLRGTLQQHRHSMQAPPSQMYPALYNATEDVNVSQRISELRGAGRRRKYKSESDALGESMTSGPSSPKRRARKIKDIPSVVSPLATSSVRNQSATFTSSRTPTELQKDAILNSGASPRGNLMSHPGFILSQPSPLPTASTHLTAAYSKLGYPARHPSLDAVTTTSQEPLTHGHPTSMQSHMASMQSRVTSVPNVMTALTGNAATMQGHVPLYPSPISSVPGFVSSQTRQLTSPTVHQKPFPAALGSSAVSFHSSSIPVTHVSSVYTQPLPSVSEVSVIQHTRMQGKSEPANKELKLEVSQAKELPPATYPWPYRFPVPAHSPGAGSPASQGLHLLAVASKSQDLSPQSQMGSRKRSFSLTEGIPKAPKQESQLASPWPKEDPTLKTEKKKSTDETENAAPIAMQLLAAVAHSSSYVPGVGPRGNDSHRATAESVVTPQSLPDLPRKNSPSGSLSVESPMQSSRPFPELKQHREIGSPELKKIKMERNSVSPKSPRSDARSPRSDTNRQSPTSLPRVPASRRHLTLDLKSPLTSRMKSPGASEASKSLLQIDPKSLLTPEALSIAESVMKLASPMKANTPITPVESARELGRLMAHAYLNAGGRVENLITSTQGTMMIGPIATPTPGSGSGSTQYFIIPSPSSSQAPTGFPGPNTLFSPSASTASSLVSPLRSPLASSQPQADQAVVTTNHAPHFKRVPPQKPDCQGIFEEHILSHVKTNSALRHKIRCSKLSRSTARNSKITQVTFCCVKRPQPMYVQQGGNRKISMYSNWRPGGNCPHPLGISWKAHLALYDTGRNKKPKFYYVTTSISPPQGGIVTDSAGWKPESAPKTADSQSHSEGPHSDMMDMSVVKPGDAGCTLEKSTLDADTLKSKEKKAKEASDHSEPSRIPIFSGGYKSNENYVYVRGRGRGKYVCEECGIRCKKPSMLKKHIRTHTDMRPYQCQICNFAFKTKGNLTKHMKSKAHSKKCTKNGISTTDESCMEHQFSDADDEDTDSADGETSDEDEDEDEDDDISETHSESAVPVSGAVPHRERYSSVPNIQDMPESIDGQGRPLVWHQYDQARMKKGHGESHDRPRRDSTGSIPALDSSNSGGNLKEMPEEKQPVKLSRSEVVGKLSRHLTNRHQQSLEKAQKAGVSTVAKPGEVKGHDSSKLFDLSQLPPFHPGLLPQPTKLMNLSQFPSSRVDGQPPEPPLLDKYGHIVLTTSNSSMSQYRLSTTVQENPHSQSKLRPSNGNIESRITPPVSVPPLASLEKQLTRKSQPNVEFLTAGSPFLHSKLGGTSAVSPVFTTSGTSSPKEPVPNLVQTPSSLSLHTDTKATSSSGYPSHHEHAPVSIASIPPGAANLVVGVNTMHAIPSRDMHMFPCYPVSGEARAQQVPYQGSFGVSPHLQRMMSPPFLSAYQDLSRPVASSRANPVVSPSSQIKLQLSPRVHASSAAASHAAGETGKPIPPPICVEAISDDEDESSPRKRQKLNPQQHGLMVSGSINNPPWNSPSSVPSWMSKPGSAIKQLLLAKPSVLPVSHESPKPSFFSPFLPPSLASPKLVKSSVAVPVTSSHQPPLVSPMVPSKMMQLPPTILSQVRSPTVQSSSFPPRDEHRDSPVPFVPPIARSKTQFQWNFPQSHSSADKQQASGDQIPLEVSEELVSSPTHLGNHKCSSCNKVFMKPSQLRIHMRIHLEENSFLCPECMLSFPTRILLAKHERSEEHLSKVDAVELPSASGESDPRPFKCKECQIAFRIPGHLAKHLRSRGHRMTLEREGKLPVPKEELLCQEMSDMEQGDLVIDDSHQPSSPAGSSDKTDSASEAGDMDAAEAMSAI